MKLKKSISITYVITKYGEHLEVGNKKINIKKYSKQLKKQHSWAC